MRSRVASANAASGLQAIPGRTRFGAARPRAKTNTEQFVAFLDRTATSRTANRKTKEKTMGNFSIALSGLQADSVALNTIGNNLANLNTTAFKGQTTSFEDLFYQQIGQSGSGDRDSAWSRNQGFGNELLTLPRGQFCRTPMRIRRIWHWPAMASLSCSRAECSR